MAAKILLVEDEAVLRKHLARLLTRQGYEVATAGSRAQALDELARTHFETLLLDVKLPDGDGLDFLADLGEGQRPPHTVVMTASGSLENEERAERLRVSCFLHKPLDFSLLLQHVGPVPLQLPPSLDRDHKAP